MLARAVATVAVALGTSTLLLTLSFSPQSSKVGALKGQTGATGNDGRVLSPQSATIYVMYQSGLRAGSFTHAYDTDTAGGQFHDRKNKSLSSDKELKTLMKSTRHAPLPEAADEIAAHYLQSLDQALAATSEWVAKHPKNAWQLRVITPDAQGSWSVGGLEPGSYEIVIRGRIAGYDADWEAGVDLAPGETVSLPLVRPRFICRSKP
jgi:hypothetical protein